MVYPIQKDKGLDFSNKVVESRTFEEKFHEGIQACTVLQRVIV